MGKQTNERRWLKEEDINYGRGIKKCRMKEFLQRKNGKCQDVNEEEGKGVIIIIIIGSIRIVTRLA